MLTESKLTLLATRQANVPINRRRGVETRNMTLSGKPADPEDGRLMSQNNHLLGFGCQFLLQHREGEEMRK